MIVNVSGMVEPKLRGWGEDALSKRPSNPHDPHGRPNAYLAAKKSTRVRRSPLSRAHVLMEPNRPLKDADQGESRARADPPNRGFMTLVWSNWPPLRARVRGETPQSGAHTVSQGPTGPSTLVFLRARADPPNRGFMTLLWSNRPPLWSRARGETPQSGAHTILQGPTGPSTPVFLGREQIPPIGVSWLSYGPIDPLYKRGWEERPPNRGLIPSHKAQSALDSNLWEREQIPPIGVSWLSWSPIDSLIDL